MRVLHFLSKTQANNFIKHAQQAGIKWEHGKPFKMKAAGSVAIKMNADGKETEKLKKMYEQELLGEES